MKKGIFPAVIFCWIISSTALADNHFYILGLGIGSSSFALNEANIVADFGQVTNSSSFNDDSTSFSFFGGIPFDDYLSLEFDVVLAGDLTAKENNRSSKLFDVTTFAITAVLSKPVSDNIDLFARIGAHMWDISESSGDLDTINNAVDLTFGLGADINIFGSHARKLRVQWNHYQYDDIYIEDSDTLSLNLLFEIGY